jgi:hypothetical protein
VVQRLGNGLKNRLGIGLETPFDPRQAGTPIFSPTPRQGIRASGRDTSAIRGCRYGHTAVVSSIGPPEDRSAATIALFLATGAAHANEFVLLLQEDNYKPITTAFASTGMSCAECLESHEKK